MCRGSCVQTFPVELGTVTSPRVGLGLWPVPGRAGHVPLGVALAGNGLPVWFLLMFKTVMM